MSEKITIDPEFQKLIPPLSEEEFSLLEKSIVKDGVRDALVVWAGHGVLLDGHNRYRIATKHRLRFDTVEKEFASKADAIWWMVNNQIARRNLNATQRAVLHADAEALVESIRERAREKKVEDGKTTGALAHTKPSTEGFPDNRKTLPPPSRPPTPPPSPKPAPIHVNKILAERASVSHDTMDKVLAVKRHGDAELLDKMRAGEISANKAYQTIKREQKAEDVKKAQSYIASQEAKGSASLTVGDGIGRTVECDLLLTDPPYSTDVPDIDKFVESWLYPALNGVKKTGFAYVFIGAYPWELRAYLNAKVPLHMTLEQVLVWTYKNTLGNNPKDRYKQNWQACLFYRGSEAPALDCPLTNEQWAVQEVNAPDGRQGDRFHAWQKPLELCERFIRHTTKKGAVVFDPFACTGTTLVAAAKLGRRGIGYEIDPKNADIAFGRGVSRA